MTGFLPGIPLVVAIFAISGRRDAGTAEGIPMRPLPVRPVVAVPTALLGVGLVVLAGLFVLSLVGLMLEPAPIFVIDVAATGYCFTALAVATRRRLAARRADQP